MIHGIALGGDTLGNVSVEDMSGTKSPRTGLAMMIGSATEKNKKIIS